MLKVITIILVVISAFTILGAFIPDTISGEVESAMTYFIGTQYALAPFIDVNALMTCEQIIVGFAISLGTFAIVMWIVKKTSA